MVERNEGITILPELALLYLNKSDKHMLRRFQKPVPVREVSMLTHRDFTNHVLVDVLKKQILAVIPRYMLQAKQRMIVK